MADPAPTLAHLLQEAIAEAFGSGLAATDPVLRRSQHPRFGDYQANVAMALAKDLGRTPRDVAQAIVEHLDVGGVCRSVEVAGPGFVNLTLDERYLADQVGHAATDPRLDVPEADDRHIWVVDYSAPNVAKEMHIGHLRSTVIGDALARVLGWLGHRVIRQNHIGDWGTQFGMLIEHLAGVGWASGSHTIGDLNQLYQEAQAAFERDPGFAHRARQRVVALQSGDPATASLWRELVEESDRHIEEAYGRLRVLLTREDMRGESFYNHLLEPTVDELSEKGLLREDEGALCAFPPGFSGRDGSRLPMIVRKRDGGFNYNTTDLAALRFRVRDLGADRLAYVVDARQAQHFAMLFAVAREADWLGERVEARHVPFGTILGRDGRPFRTRSGG
ncbi:MAG TPA: arginine--tRNA ligase, partial [Acidimicrobiales bacterium]|nr:arginine--tRNA ligase [Acidimicrobiales bacterium]